jgi:hypothetical protein
MSSRSDSMISSVTRIGFRRRVDAEASRANAAGASVVLGSGGGVAFTWLLYKHDWTGVSGPPARARAAEPFPPG